MRCSQIEALLCHIIYETILHSPPVVPTLANRPKYLLSSSQAAHVPRRHLYLVVFHSLKGSGQGYRPHALLSAVAAKTTVAFGDDASRFRGLARHPVCAHAVLVRLLSWNNIGFCRRAHCLLSDDPAVSLRDGLESTLPDIRACPLPLVSVYSMPSPRFASSPLCVQLGTSLPDLWRAMPRAPLVPVPYVSRRTCISIHASSLTPRTNTAKLVDFRDGATSSTGPHPLLIDCVAYALNEQRRYESWNAVPGQAAVETEGSFHPRRAPRQCLPRASTPLYHERNSVRLLGICVTGGLLSAPFLHLHADALPGCTLPTQRVSLFPMPACVSHTMCLLFLRSQSRSDGSLPGCPPPRSSARRTFSLFEIVDMYARGVLPTFSPFALDVGRLSPRAQMQQSSTLHALLYADMGPSLLHPPIRSCAHVHERQYMHPHTYRPSASPSWPLAIVYVPVFSPKPRCARPSDFYLHRANSSPTRRLIAAGHPVPFSPASPGLSSSRDLAWPYRLFRKDALVIVHCAPLAGIHHARIGPPSPRGYHSSVRPPSCSRGSFSPA
ncbi:hypothetical protein B0H13DRAFT_2349521 [Mycena leptocephala]|nr:hypothetical protein B0H13DRAFT_2349521 [Mycena leptocephala]